MGEDHIKGLIFRGSPENNLFLFSLSELVSAHVVPKWSLKRALSTYNSVGELIPSVNRVPTFEIMISNQLSNHLWRFHKSTCNYLGATMSTRNPVWHMCIPEHSKLRIQSLTEQEYLIGFTNRVFNTFKKNFLVLSWSLDWPLIFLTKTLDTHYWQAFIWLPLYKTYEMFFDSWQFHWDVFVRMNYIKGPTQRYKAVYFLVYLSLWYKFR